MWPAKQVPVWCGAEAKRRLQSALPGVEVQWLLEGDSTNSALKLMLADGLTTPTLLFTDRQTEGRGRLGREWVQAGAGLDLALSFALPLPAWAQGELRLSLVCGAAVVLALEGAISGKLGLKWPNDIQAQVEGEWRKLGGILLETTPAPAGKLWLIAGVGVNVNSTAGEFPRHLRSSLTTLADAFDRQNLAAVHYAVGSALASLFSSSPPNIPLLMNEWVQRDTTGSARYLLPRAGVKLEVVATGVDELTGALRCVDLRGNLFAVTSHSELERLR